MKYVTWWMMAAGVVLAPFAEAHFKLLEPQSWLVENDLGVDTEIGGVMSSLPETRWLKSVVPLVSEPE
jgi:hypothetical protein